MASEEERARIMAEYLAETKNGEVEEEEEFQEEDDEDDDDEYERNSKPSAEVNCPVLQGRLKFNDEQHLVYLGTWCMKVDLNSGTPRNKKTTFKLKSIHPMSKFSLPQPTTTTKLVMNGFFHTDHTDQIEPHRKIKEKGVTLQFTKNNKGSSSYQVKGEGTNAFGGFALKGTYLPNEEKQTFWLQCEKYYGGIPQDNDDESDEIESEDDQQDPQELGDLQGDADLTVEELQQKYYGGAQQQVQPSPPKVAKTSSRRKAERDERRNKRNAAAALPKEEQEEDSKPPAAKKPKTEDNGDGDLKPKASSPTKKKKKKKIIVAAEDEDDDDDDDDCGF